MTIAVKQISTESIHLFCVFLLFKIYNADDLLDMVICYIVGSLSSTHFTIITDQAKKNLSLFYVVCYKAVH